MKLHHHNTNGLFTNTIRHQQAHEAQYCVATRSLRLVSKTGSSDVMIHKEKSKDFETDNWYTGGKSLKKYLSV